MIFAYPLLLLLVPLFILGGIWIHRSAAVRARARLARFSPPSRLPQLLRSVDFAAKRRKAILFSIALCLLATVLARPLWGPRDNSKEQKGAEFFIVLDVSKSMLVRDVTPSRLAAVKSSLDAWLRTRGGDRIGLILMAGDAFIQAPLTNDYTALREVLNQSGPKSLSIGGTNISAAVAVAAKALDASGVKHKAIVIISDGENTTGQATTDVQQAHLKDRITFFTVGVGTSVGGQVPNKELPPDFAGPLKDIVRDEYGLPVTSKLDERSLRAIAAAGGGRYLEFTPEGKTWETLYAQSLSTLARRSTTFNLEDYMDLFQIPLLVAVILLAWECGISIRHKRPPAPVSAVTLPEAPPAPATTAMEKSRSALVRVVPLAIALTFGLGSESEAAAKPDPLMEKSEALIKAGRAPEAAEILRAASQRRPDDSYLMYNYGVAAYAAKQYQEAADAFSEVCVTPDKKLRAKALAQLGNANYRIGDTVIKTGNRNGAAIAFERALEYYTQSYSEKPDKASEANRKVARDRLEKLLMELGQHHRNEADKAKALPSMIAQLTKAREVYEKVTQLMPENQEAARKLAETSRMLSEKLAEQARAFRAKAEEFPDGSNKVAEQEKLNQQATQAYQQARDLAPENKPLAEEHEAFKDAVAEKMTEAARESFAEAMKPVEKAAQKELRKRRGELEKALTQTTKALAFDEDHASAQSLQEKVLQELEKIHVELADMAKALGEATAQKNPGSSAEQFTEAMQQYQKALGINPENAHAAEALAEVQDALAKQLTEVGKKEMSQVGTPPKDKNGKSEKTDAAGQLREDIGRLEKATQSFAQADALSPGKNEAASLQEDAAAKLNELRGELDQAQAAAGRQPGDQAGPPGEQQGEGEATGPQPPPEKAGQGVPKPTLSFSEIRESTQIEGMFKDLSAKQKIRDW